MWAQHFSTNQPFLDDPLSFVGLQIGASHPTCFTEPMGRADQPFRGLDFDFSFEGGDPVRASQAAAVEFRAGDRVGRVFVGSSLARDPSCLAEGEYPENELTLDLIMDEQGEAPRACVGDFDCGAAEYCERGTGSCTDGGRCAPRPSFCGAPALQATVCGCDGNLYEGPCAANQAGIDSSLDGAAARCPGMFLCGALLCRIGEQACLHETRSGPGGQPMPYCLGLPIGNPPPQGCDPEAPTCACVQDPQCTCTQPAPGQIELACIYE